MGKEFYTRIMKAGRYCKVVQYKRALPGDSKAARRAKSAHTCAAQKYINNKNATNNLEMLLWANFDSKKACFCTMTFSNNNLPESRKSAKQYASAFFAGLRAEWRRRGKDALKFIYTVEGEALDSSPSARPIEGDQWEIAPWREKDRWEDISAKRKQDDENDPVRFHVHCFLILNKEDYEVVKAFWKAGQVYINPMKVNEITTFNRLASYVTKERRDEKKPVGDRCYIPSQNLEKPVIEGHWCEEYETIAPPQGAEVIETGREDTFYSSFRYCTYRLPRQQQTPQLYKSKGSLSRRRTHRANE